MVILGIDPGFGVTGFGVLKREGSKSFLLDYGALKMCSAHTLAARIAQFYNFFKQKIIQWSITDIALETPFLGKNAQNFLKLGYLRGIIYLLSHEFNLELHEFAPREVKLSVTGFGGADKDQVARVVLRLFPALLMPEKLDITDALAVTLCALWKNKRLCLLSKS